MNERTEAIIFHCQGIAHSSRKRDDAVDQIILAEEGNSNIPIATWRNIADKWERMIDMEIEMLRSKINGE